MSKDQLQSQMQTMLPYARACYAQDESAGMFAGWRQSVKSTKGRPRLSRDSALMKVLHEYQGWDAMSSSCVERGLSRTVKSVGSHRLHMSPQRRWYEAKVTNDVLGLQCDQRRSIILAAMQIWTEHWGQVRASGRAERERHFSCRRAASNKVTERALGCVCSALLVDDLA